MGAAPAPSTRTLPDGFAGSAAETWAVSPVWVGGAARLEEKNAILAAHMRVALSVTKCWCWRTDVGVYL